MTQSRAFVLKQIASLLRLGVSPMDAERTVAWVSAHLPEGEDAATWVPTAADLSDDGVLSAEALLDARMAWYADRGVERRFKRLLDAGVE